MDHEDKILKEIKYLKLYAGLLTLILLSVLIMSFVGPRNKKYKELTVQRLNIVSPKGKPRMVISNSKLQSPGMLDGKKFHPRKRAPGMIFFNKEGAEVGGLIYDVKGLVVSIDQYKRDQIMQLQYEESNNGKRKYGLQLWDRNGEVKGWDLLNKRDSLHTLYHSWKKANKILKKRNGGVPVSSRRMFVGKNKKQQMGLFIKDKQGRKRIEIYVSKHNKVRMKFLNEKGQPIPLDSLK